MRNSPPALPGSQAAADSPLDRALALMLTGERDAALRWSGAVVQQDPSMSSALILTCRLLADAGRTEAALEGLELGVKRAIDAGNLPLAVAAVADLRALGRDVSSWLDDIAAAFCADSPRLAEGDEAPPPPPLPGLGEIAPLSTYLTGPALLSKVTAIVHAASTAYEESGDSGAPLVAPLPLFSALKKEGLRALISAFEMITVPAGSYVIEQGAEGAEAYIVARGELEVTRDLSSRENQAAGNGEPVAGEDAPSVVLARLTNGALFGEMALLSRAPRAASVIARRPSILLLARRTSLEAVAEDRPDVGVELAAHCRRRMVTNLVRTSPVLLAVDSESRPALVERLQTQVFERGEKIISEGDEGNVLHLIASGEVAVVRRESDEPFVLATLGVGDVIGEVSLILKRKANADVVAVHPTVTLRLEQADFLELVQAHPRVLVGLYFLALERDEETASVLQVPSTRLGDDVLV